MTKQLFCTYVGQADYNFKSDPSYVEKGFWELGLYKDEDACMKDLWDAASAEADSWGECDEEEEEWSEFVDRVMTYGCCLYDPNLHNHRELEGFEELRPELRDHRIAVLISSKESYADRIKLREERLNEYVLNARADIDDLRVLQGEVECKLAELEGEA